METFLYYSAVHFLGDFAFQTKWMAVEKEKKWFANLCHAAVYASAFIVFAQASAPVAAVLFVSHFWIDPLSARWKLINSLYLDQLLHLLIILLVLLIN
jgi:hypothetical protein